MSGYTPPPPSGTNLSISTVFVANNDLNDLLVCSTDGKSTSTWTANHRVGQKSWETPSLAVFNTNLQVAFAEPDVAAGVGHSLAICSSQDGVQWSDKVPINQASHDGSGPSLAVFDGKLWVAFIAANDSFDILVCSSQDGVHWSGNTRVNQASRMALSLAVFNNQLWLAFIANQPSNDVLVCNSSDGLNWSPNIQVHQGSKTAPSLTVFNKQLWLAFVAKNDSNDVLVCNSVDGTNWSGNVQIGQQSKTAPSLAVDANGNLCVAFVANNPSNAMLLCTSQNGLSWSPNIPVNQASKTAAILAPTMLYGATIRPRYQILTVVYAPPGTNGGHSTSSVEYSHGSSAGTTTTISNSTKAGVSVTVSVGIPKELGASASFGVSSNQTDTTALDVKKSDTYTLKVSGPSADGIDHDHDLIYLWLNPIVTAAFDSNGNVRWGLAVDGPDMIIQYVYAGWLKDPVKYKEQLAPLGLADDEYPEILKADPLAYGGPIPDGRYVQTTQTFPYRAPYTATDPVPTQTYNAQDITTDTETHSTQQQIDIKISVSFDLTAIWSLKSEFDMTFTYTSTKVNTKTATNTATVVVGGPAFGYTGSTNIAVYWDTIYRTFMFAFIGSSPSTSGTLTDADGKAVAHKPIALKAGDSTFKTFTDHTGTFQFFGSPDGQATVIVDDKEFPIASGASAPMNALKLT